MIFGAVVAAIGMMVNTAVSAGTSAAANKKKVEAYKNAASAMSKATQNYSGEKANAKMTEAGMAEQAKNANLYYDPSWNGGSSAMSSFNKNTQGLNAPDLYSQGANRAKTTMDSKWNAEKAQQEQNLKQADINYNADIATGKAVANGVSGLTNMVGQFGGWAGSQNTKPNANIAGLGDMSKKLGWMVK